MQHKRVIHEELCNRFKSDDKTENFFRPIPKMIDRDTVDIRCGNRLHRTRRHAGLAQERQRKPHGDDFDRPAHKDEADFDIIAGAALLGVGVVSDGPVLPADAERVRLVVLSLALDGLFGEGVAFHLELEHAGGSNRQVHAGDRHCCSEVRDCVCVCVFA
jgi:hypothetical protein